MKYLRIATGVVVPVTACVLAFVFGPAILSVGTLDVANAQVALQPTQVQTLQASSYQMPLKAPADRAASNAPPPQIGAACNTNSATTNGFPSGVHGAVGPANLVVGTNVDLGVYDKATCAQVSSVGLTTLFASLGIASNEILFNAQALYDPIAERFLVTAEGCITSVCFNHDQNQYFAVSKDNTGTSWWLYKLVIVMHSTATAFCVADVTKTWETPHVGSMNGSNPRWMIAANVTSGTPTSSLLTIDKTASLTGGMATVRCFPALALNLAATNVRDLSNTAYLLSPGSGSGNAITRYALTPGSSSDSLVQTSDISITSWMQPPLAGQPNGEPLETLDGAFVSATIQNGTSLWNVHSIASARGGMSNLATGRLSILGRWDESPLYHRSFHHHQ
jgi:hypothetical protein